MKLARLQEIERPEGQDAPPIPTRVTDTSGRGLFTGRDILAGQEAFMRNGLMEYGSIFGHGAYLGPDFTADYLRKSATLVRDPIPGSGTVRQVWCTSRQGLMALWSCSHVAMNNAGREMPLADAAMCPRFCI